ncbi:hypothetical protein nbrc107696_01430 [Gordonia spumicola]|uniref:Phage capsid-like C-terminal domain-containing protein n=1 Tax=Gordonia spumicola TaxID=589161 RepID=A0A7I9V3A8_9ACTN|nr:phage major capsid protein [Gordonia spumicola]GED99696.1 hypothetical protein nbrc107696_01430 [Gordonia spumicola]
MATTATHNQILSDATVGQLVIQPLMEQSIAGQALSPLSIATHEIRFPVVSDDPTAGWVAEGAEFAQSTNTLDEVVCTPRKLGGLTVFTSELAADSSPAAQQVIGDGLVRDLSRKIDAALCTDQTGAGAPEGLATLAGVSTLAVATAGFEDIDPFNAADYLSAAANGSITAWIANPTVAAQLTDIKETSTSTRPLLQPDPTNPAVRQILGRPLLVSTQVPAKTVWGIDSRYAHLVIREQASLESDASTFFTSDRIALRAKIRVGFAFTNPAALVKITTA